MAVPGLPRSEAWLLAELARGGPSLVALSGGVDSTLVAWYARRALGVDSVAVTLTGPSLPRAELVAARAAAQAVGIAHVEVAADPLQAAEYRSNPNDRCYFCRQVEAAVLRRWGEERGVRRFIDGVHLDDLGEDRPGLRAMDAAGFWHPLAEAGWNKQQVRAAARALGLPNWDRPSNACLASRVRHGQAITAPLLERVDRAEELVRAQGFSRVRVRVEGGAGRVEVGAEEVERLASPAVARAVRRELRRLGFHEVQLDPVGYRARPGM
jgi:uncharacterized protein